MTTAIDLGTGDAGAAVIDLEELLATRLLVQGNSGSGKSHLLRRLVEQSARHVQQVIVDPEGDFVSLAGAHDHLVVDAGDYAHGEIAAIAARVREHRVSVVLNLEALEVDAQLRCAGTFLNGLFDAPRERWHPVLVVVDEAQLFAPAAAGEVAEDARRISLAAMTNLMCRGRKRGLAGVIATQRLAKLAKNVAAEASNFLMGRTFLDIDMARAADLLGMERRQAEAIRDLERGQFLALGPALCRRPALIRIGAVATGSRGGSPSLAPLPQLSGDARQALVLDRLEAAEPARTPMFAPEPIDHLLGRIDAGPPPAPDQSPLAPEEGARIGEEVLAALLAEPAAALQPVAALYRDYTVRCRSRGLPRPPLEATQFARAVSLLRAGFTLADMDEAGWAEAAGIARALPDELAGVFMAVARAAREGAPCPGGDELARVYGTQSAGRAKRLLDYLEAKGAIAVRVALGGRRTVSIPALGWQTAPEDGPALSLPPRRTRRSEPAFLS